MYSRRDLVEQSCMLFQIQKYSIEGNKRDTLNFRNGTIKSVVTGPFGVKRSVSFFEICDMLQVKLFYT